MKLKKAIINRYAFETMTNHAVTGIPNEIGGLLIGKPCMNEDGHFISWIIEAVKGSCFSERARVVIKEETYNKAWQILDKYEAKGEKLIVIGYYHSHPDIGVFLSGYDKETMWANWLNLHNISIVLDPVRNIWGCFGYSGEKLVRIPSSIFDGDYKVFWKGEEKSELNPRGILNDANQ